MLTTLTSTSSISISTAAAATTAATIAATIAATATTMIITIFLFAITYLIFFNKNRWRHVEQKNKFVPFIERQLLDDDLHKPNFFGRLISYQMGSEIYGIWDRWKPVCVIASNDAARVFYQNHTKHIRTPSFHCLGFVCEKMLGHAVGTSFDTNWSRHRSPFKQYFSNYDAMKYENLIVEHSARLIDKLCSMSNEWNGISMNDLKLETFTLEILAKILYGKTLSNQALNELFEIADLHNKLVKQMSKNWTRMKIFQYIPSQTIRDLKKYCEWWSQYNKERIQQILINNDDKCILSHLINLKKNDQLLLSNIELLHNLEEILLFNIDVMYSSLGAIFMNLARYPVWQQRLLESKNNDNEMNMFINESARMCPSLALSFPEETPCDMEIAGYLIPANTTVVIDTFSINHDPRYFKEPDTFNPLRFQDDTALVHRYHRFGLGPRKCMGMNYANLIIKSVIKQIVTRVDLKFENENDSLLQWKQVCSKTDNILSYSEPCSQVKTEGLPFFTPFLIFPKLKVRDKLWHNQLTTKEMNAEVIVQITTQTTKETAKETTKETAKEPIIEITKELTKQITNPMVDELLTDKIQESTLKKVHPCCGLDVKDEDTFQADANTAKEEKMYDVDTSTMKIEDVDEQQHVFSVGKQVIKENGKVIVGISINNSYFNEKTISSLLNYLIPKHNRICTFIPDEPSKWTYQGLGYSMEESTRKVRLNTNRLQRWVDQNTKNVDHYYRIDWKNKIESHDAFQDSKNKIMTMYEENKEFRQYVQETTKEVLQNKQKDNITLNDGITIAAQFLLSELAFLWRAHEILEIDRNEKIAYIYHRKWPVFEKFVNGDFFNGKPIENLGFIVLSKI